MNVNDNITLIQSKSNCNACGACLNICPTNAIKMKADEYGYIFPDIDKEKCIKCKKCINVCYNQNDNVKSKDILKVYASEAQSNEVKLKSASGGIFYLLAKKCIENNGIVFGASMELENDILIVKHKMVDDLQKLADLQGSKYVQSDIGFTYRDTKRNLDQGRNVLFSGTPCQIAGLYSFLGKNYDNLITIDIICHGVPSVKFFQDYVTILMKKNKGKIKDFKFRDKTKGWKLNACVYYWDKKERIKSKIIPCELSSYYKNFLDGNTYRESCYKCKFANEKRISDITLGDYWGFEKQHKELDGEFDKRTGISCVIVNSTKGEKILKSISKITLYESTLEKVTASNMQLREPSKKGKEREKILKLYNEKGYIAIEQDFNKKRIKRLLFFYIKKIIPTKLKQKIKGYIKKEKT